MMHIRTDSVISMAYIERASLKAVAAFLPQEPGLRAHLIRVGALVSQAARVRGFTEEQTEALELAGLLHHYPMDLAEIHAASKALADMGVIFSDSPPGDDPPALPETAAEIVRVYQGCSAPDATLDGIFLKEASSILESANLFDEQVENLPYDDQSTEDSIAELMHSGLICRPFATAVDAFRVLSRQQLNETVRRLPVFPKAAMEALRMARDPNVGTREIEKAIARDPVLAGEMTQLANSGLFGAWLPVNSLSMALARVGTIAAGKLIAAAAVRRCFVSGKLHRMWAHSLEAAESAVLIAAETQHVDAGEAYLAGLVHDVGRLGFELSPAAADMRGWQEAGFPYVYAEFLVSGTDHAAIGAGILKKWLFPDSIVEAVRYHHRPELTSSRLAAVLYAAEELEETLPSCARDNTASKRLDLETIRELRAVG
jgi:HD-like signal output (HDOD) protein